MKSAKAFIIGLALMAAAAPAWAQQWRDQRESREDSRHAPTGFPGAGAMPRGQPQRGPRGGPQAASQAPPRGGPAGGGFPAWGEPPREPWGGGEAEPGWRAQQQELRQGRQEGQFVGLGKAIQAVRQRSPGRQLDAGIETWGGRTAYRVRWAAPNGRRMDYIVDARTGEILSADAAP